MPYATHAELFDAVVKSRDHNDLTTYLACYETTATIVLQPGTIGQRQDALRGFFSFFTNHKPTLTVALRFIEAPKSRYISPHGH
jgi:hypothetical protein